MIGTPNLSQPGLIVKFRHRKWRAEVLSLEPAEPLPCPRQAWFGRELVRFADDLGFHIAENWVHMHDLQATILQLLGFDHTRLTDRYQGRDFRLTDVHGQVVNDFSAIALRLGLVTDSSQPPESVAVGSPVQESRLLH